MPFFIVLTWFIIIYVELPIDYHFTEAYFDTANNFWHKLRHHLSAGNDLFLLCLLHEFHYQFVTTFVCHIRISWGVSYLSSEWTLLCNYFILCNICFVLRGCYKYSKSILINNWRGTFAPMTFGAILICPFLGQDR